VATSTLTLFLISVVAGVLGSLLGLGGGIIIVPALTLLFGYDIRTAVAASTVSIIATSTGAAVAYLQDRLTNTRVAMWLEMGTASGAMTGAVLAGLVSAKFLFFLFALLMLYSAYNMYQVRKSELPAGVQPDALSSRLRLAGAYHDQVLDRTVEYQVTNTKTGLILMFFSGAAAGLLGIGAGVFKVLAMDQVMKMPIKASTATSNFMIGVTAAASSVVYFVRGDVKPLVAGPVALGVLAGALVGTRIMVRLKGTTLRKIFIPVLLAVAVQMLWKGLM
jgi:uncharacterized membrane protein YfcA